MVGDPDGFVPLSAAAPELDGVRDAVERGPPDRQALEAAPAARDPREHCRFTTPMAFGKRWGIGLNYVDHADDLDATHPDQPASFMQPATAVTGPGGPIRLPPEDLSSRVTASLDAVGTLEADVVRRDG